MTFGETVAVALCTVLLTQLLAWAGHFLNAWLQRGNEQAKFFRESCLSGTLSLWQSRQQTLFDTRQRLGVGGRLLREVPRLPRHGPRRAEGPSCQR